MADEGELEPVAGHPVLVFECPGCGYTTERYKRRVYRPVYCRQCPNPDALPKVRFRLANGEEVEVEDALELARRD